MLFVFQYVGACISFVLLMILWDMHLDNQLLAFDLDKDGVFSPEEQTAEQQAAMDDVTNDGGRIILFPLVFLMYLFASISTAIAMIFARKFFSKRSDQ